MLHIWLLEFLNCLTVFFPKIKIFHKTEVIIFLKHDIIKREFLAVLGFTAKMGLLI